MKISIPQVDLVIDCKKDTCYSIIIENKKVLYEILCDIKQQLDGGDGAIVLSEDNRVLDISKYAELLTQFIPFEINQKSLLNKVMVRFQQVAMDEQHYCVTSELLSTIESYLLDLSVELTGNLKFVKTGWDSILKAIGVEFEDDYNSLAEKILDYLELVREYDKEKLFITFNLRSFIPDVEMRDFLKDIMARNYQIIMIESSEYAILDGEKRYIIDENLCVMC